MYVGSSAMVFSFRTGRSYVSQLLLLFFFISFRQSPPLLDFWFARAIIFPFVAGELRAFFFCMVGPVIAPFSPFFFF